MSFCCVFAENQPPILYPNHVPQLKSLGVRTLHCRLSLRKWMILPQNTPFYTLIRAYYTVNQCGKFKTMYPHHWIHHFPINFVPNWCYPSEIQVNARVKACTPITFYVNQGTDWVLTVLIMKNLQISEEYFS